jgi:hypothetical protein
MQQSCDSRRIVETVRRPPGALLRAKSGSHLEQDLSLFATTFTLIYAAPLLQVRVEEGQRSMRGWDLFHQPLESRFLSGRTLSIATIVSDRGDRSQRRW